MYFIKKIWNPEIYQGKYKRKNYFEGWYYKLTDKSKEKTLVIIPGISFGASEFDAHAFIQIIDSVNCKSYYTNFETSDFKCAKNNFGISIGENYFDNHSIFLNIKNIDIDIYGSLEFTNIDAYPKKIFSPGIMGPFSFIPFMECYHGIINMQQQIAGCIFIDNKKTDFSQGSGYIEKDWGRSFPETWVWLQSNIFSVDKTTLMLSIAKIPWLRKYFTGFISFIKINEKLYRFATYTGAKVTKLYYKNDTLDINIESHKYRMEINAKYLKDDILKAPKNGTMSREIKESINSIVEVFLTDKKSRTLYHGIGYNAGMEISGDISLLL